MRSVITLVIALAMLALQYWLGTRRKPLLGALLPGGILRHVRAYRPHGPDWPDWRCGCCRHYRRYRSDWRYRACRADRCIWRTRPNGPDRPHGRNRADWPNRSCRCHRQCGRNRCDRAYWPDWCNRRDRRHRPNRAAGRGLYRGGAYGGYRSHRSYRPDRGERSAAQRHRYALCGLMERQRPDGERHGRACGRDGPAHHSGAGAGVPVRVLRGGRALHRAGGGTAGV